MHEIKVVNKKNGGTGYYIGRPSALGNLYTSKNHGQGIKVSTLQKSIDMFETWLQAQIRRKDPAVSAELNKIYAMAMKEPVNLVCWCAPGICHGDIIKKVLERMHKMKCEAVES